MLVPVLALADTTKALVANVAEDIYRVRIRWYTSMSITGCMILIWLALVPLFPSFAAFLTSDDETTVRWAITAFSLLFVPYVLFCFNTVSDGVFYGIGQTKYMAYQSFLTNGTVYVVAFLLYVSGIWEPTFQSVMLLFSLGILVDSMLTVLFLLKVLYFGKQTEHPVREVRIVRTELTNRCVTGENSLPTHNGTATGFLEHWGPYESTFQRVAHQHWGRIWSRFKSLVEQTGRIRCAVALYLYDEGKYRRLPIVC